MNADIISEITLDVAGKANKYTTVRAKQGDNFSRWIRAKITNGNVDYVVSPESTVMINFKRYDEQTKSYTGEVEADGKVLLPLTYWALELPYMVTCDVAIIETITVSGEQRQRKLTTFSFYIDVEAASVSDNDEQADEEASFLLQLIQETKDLAEDFKGHFVTSSASEVDVTVANRTHYCYSGNVSTCHVTIPATAEQGWVADIALRIGSTGVPILFTNNSTLTLRVVQYSAEMARAIPSGTCTFGVSAGSIVHLYVSVDGLIVQCVAEVLKG